MQRSDIRKSSDETTNVLLYEGATMAQMAVLFKIDERTLKRKIYGLNPVGRRYNTVIYDVAEVAPRLAKMTEEQIDEAMRRLNHADLPKMLTKEYWNGRRARQAFELAEGDLWETTRVITEVGEMVKVLKMELDLLTDGIERNTEMTDKQREVAASLVEGAKINMLKRLRERFETPAAKAKRIAGDTKPAQPAPWSDDDEL